MAGFAMGGPFGAMMGAALGHAADSGALPRMPMPGVAGGFWAGGGVHPARIAAMFAPREQIFALSMVSLAAKLARCDGPVTRPEIDAFKQQFSIPPASAQYLGRLFDQARDTPDDFEPYAQQLGEAFADSRDTLEAALAALFAIAKADAPINPRELDFLGRTARGFGLDGAAWDRARGGTSRAMGTDNGPDPYAVLGVSKVLTDDALRAAWKKLVRENHPDTLASRGAGPEAIAKAGEKVASINAAWDRIKRERKL
jgi:DnaJ like chaperone protein